MPTRCNRGFYCRSYCLPVNQHPANRTPNPQLHTRPATWNKHSTKYHMQQPLYNTLELLMMGIMMPETCWASNKICNKKPLLHLVGIFFPHINDDARSKSHQIWTRHSSLQFYFTLPFSLSPHPPIFFSSFHILSPPHPCRTIKWLPPQCVV